MSQKNLSDIQSRYVENISPTILIFILFIFMLSTMINAPNLIVGYGLVIPTMMMALIFFRPWRGVSLFFMSHLIAGIILIYTSSMFIEIVILSLIVRSIILAVLGYLIINKILSRSYTLLLTIVSLDVIIAYTIGLLYYGHDAIEVGLDIYSLLYTPFVYAAYKQYVDGRNYYAVGIVLSMILFYFSAAYFPSIPTLLWSIILLIILGLSRRYILEYRNPIFILSLIITIILIYMSLPAIYYNFYTATYPYHKHYTVRGEGIYSYNSLNRDVWGLERLRIMDNYVVVRGRVVTDYFIAEDGDICFDVELDPEFHYMLSIGSLILRRGRIHVEIVPADQDTVQPPPKGAYIEMRGTWVIDTDHGSWSEIHPVRDIKIISE